MRRPKTYEEMRDCIRKFMLEAKTSECRKFWDVITALRGPDNSNVARKSAATAVIRTAFLGKDAVKSVGRACGIICAEADDAIRLERRKLIHHGHFAAHAQEAFCALGLKWTEINRDIGA